LWCDQNYMGYHNKVGDIWQIPWYAFKDEGHYQMEFECDLSEAPAKRSKNLAKRAAQNEG